MTSSQVRTYSSVLISACALIVSSIVLVLELNQPNVAFVRSAELVYKYGGMREAQERYQGKESLWKKELDSLESEYRAALGQYVDEQHRLPIVEQKAREESLRFKKASLEEYKWKMQQRAANEDKELTQGVLNQINSFVEDYGKEHGYDIILGTTSTGSLLFGEPGFDITEEVLKSLNQHYIAGNHTESHESKSE